MRIAIIGAGNVGTNLYHAFQQKHIHATLIHARPLMENPSVCIATDGTSLEGYSADAYIYTVADHVLPNVIACINAPQALHIHTSGSMPISVFGPDKPHAGVLYFFQSFSKSHLIDDWTTIPAFYEGKNIDDIAAIYSIAQTLTSHIYEANQHDRERLHIAGVFANNFTNLMYRVAEDILRDTQIPFRALWPLIGQTAEKIKTIAPKDAQTGPASRKDNNIIQHQQEILSIATPGAEFSEKEKKEIYNLLTQIILSR